MGEVSEVMDGVIDAFSTVANAMEGTSFGQQRLFVRQVKDFFLGMVSFVVGSTNRPEESTNAQKADLIKDVQELKETSEELRNKINQSKTNAMTKLRAVNAFKKIPGGKRRRTRKKRRTKKRKTKRRR